VSTLQVGREQCAICAASDELAAKSIVMPVGSGEFRQEVRAQLLIAFVFGLRRHVLPICADCGARLRQAAHVVPGGDG